ncbi:MAG: SO2930 family diheme c-type cytochrome [Pseudohongiellaceae bacterium]
MLRRATACALFLLTVLLQACGPGDPQFHAGERPQRLSGWNLFTLTDTALTPNPATLRISPANTLFTDYAHKLRTLWIPEGKQIQLVANELDFPVGTVLSKTFYYPATSTGEFLLQEDSAEQESVSLTDHRLLETRLLVRRETGWDAFPYVWNEEQTEAFLRLAGASIPVTLQSAAESNSFTYFVPNENQCSGCHQTEHPNGGMHPLGAKARQLNHVLPFDGEGLKNQLAAIVERDWFNELPVIEILPQWKDETLSIDLRARAYLDINCGHCHNPAGAADTSALLLDGFNHSGFEMGLCKPPVAAGGGSGNLQFSIVPGQPAQSILLYRMESTNPATMMPELGRTLIHREGVELIREWIGELSGSC